MATYGRQRINIFVSYSHQDAALVGPVVRLLRATQGLVFQDSDSIKPGRRWREEIEVALGRATLVIVFWCAHSSESVEVTREYKVAIAAKKDLLPVLLDSTPVPGDLSDFQGIDFRELSGKGHGAASYAPVSRSRSKTLSGYGWGCIAAIVVPLVAVVLSSNSLSAFGYVDSPVTVLADVLFVVGLLALLLWVKRRALTGAPKTAEAEPTEQQHLMAESLRTELMRRADR